MFLRWLLERRPPELVRGLWHGLLHLLYPPSCHLCGRLLPRADALFCPGCAARLGHDTSPACPRCAAAVGPYSASPRGCPACRSERFAFRRAVRFAPYDGLLREAILRLKHSSGELLAEVLGRHWASCCREQILALGAEVLIPVPLHWRRRLRRGYNQSEAIAWGLSAVLGLPCRPAWLRRVRHTPSQHLASPAQRARNTVGAFAVPRGVPLRGRSILLVDDVLTTGATCHEAGRALRRAGAREVAVAVLARAG